jgi:hypothetical protein
MRLQSAAEIAEQLRYPGTTAARGASRRHAASGLFDPASAYASLHDHGVTLATRDPKTVKDAVMSRDLPRLLLDPTEEIIGSATRKVLDCFDALLAERHKHGRRDPGDIL